MFRNKLIRFILVTLLLGFISIMLLDWKTQLPSTRFAVVIVVGFATLLAAGLVLSNRDQRPLRLVAGIISLGYITLFLVEMLSFIRGKPQQLRFGESSLAAALIGLVVYALPLMLFALSGYQGTRWASFSDFLISKEDIPRGTPHQEP